MSEIFLQFFNKITFGYPVLLGLVYSLIMLAIGLGFYWVTQKLSAVNTELLIQTTEVHIQMLEAQEQLRDVHNTLKKVKRNVPFKLFEIINKSLIKQVETLAAFVLGLCLKSRSTLVKLFSFSLLKEVFKQVKKIEWYRF